MTALGLKLQQFQMQARIKRIYSSAPCQNGQLTEMGATVCSQEVATPVRAASKVLLPLPPTRNVEKQYRARMRLITDDA